MSKVIIFSSTAFQRDAKQELKELFGDSSHFEDLFDGNFIFYSEESKTQSLAKIRKNEPIFVHNALPLDFYIDSFKGYNLIANRILEEDLIQKNKSFIIETVTYGASLKSRDLEVQIGSLLEKMGFKVDPKNFKQIIGIVTYKDKIYVGSSEVDKLIYPYLNLSKRFARESAKESRLNRAQFKLIEALERFNLQLDNGGKYALDLGAAPGGWAKVLSSKGYEVIAIDKGELDASLKGNSTIHHIKETITPENIETIKTSLEKIIGNDKVAILTNDTNLSPEDSTYLIKGFARYLPKKGRVIMTLKSVKRNVLSLFDKVKKSIKEDYEIIKIKHLEQNRREITLYMKKK